MLFDVTILRCHIFCTLLSGGVGGARCGAHHARALQLCGRAQRTEGGRRVHPQPALPGTRREPNRVPQGKHQPVRDRFKGVIGSTKEKKKLEERGKELGERDATKDQKIGRRIYR